MWDPATGRRVTKLGSHYLRRRSQTVPLELGTGKPLDRDKTPLKHCTHDSAGAAVRDPIVECFTSEGHGGEATGVAFAPEGGRDHAAIVGGLDRRAERHRFESSLHGHAEGAMSLAFSAVGRWLVSASDGSPDASAHVWLWHVDWYREGALVGLGGTKGPTAVAVNPATGDLVLGRVQLKTVETGPVGESPPRVAPPVPAAEVDDGRPGVLGYALVDEVPAWPDGGKHRITPEKPAGRFIVVAAALPFARLKTTAADYERLLAASRADPEAPLPLKLSSLLICPRRIALRSKDGPDTPGVRRPVRPGGERGVRVHAQGTGAVGEHDQHPTAARPRGRPPRVGGRRRLHGRRPAAAGGRRPDAGAPAGADEVPPGQAVPHRDPRLRHGRRQDAAAVERDPRAGTVTPPGRRTPTRRGGTGTSGSPWPSWSSSRSPAGGGRCRSRWACTAPPRSARRRASGTAPRRPGQAVAAATAFASP